MKPYKRLPDSIEHEGITYKLNLSYTAFFAVSDVLDDDRLMNMQKISTALDIFVKGKHPEDPELLTKIYDLIKEDRPKSDGPTYMDIEQDWHYISASFQQAYNINLYEDKDIHILRFQALLQGLPKDTKMVTVIGIRSADVPEPNKHNSKQIAELMRLKTIYALKGKGNDYQTGLGKLFDLLSMRVNNG